MTDLILYTTDDGRSQIKLRAQEQTVWLTQLEMAALFDATKQNISLHLKNVSDDGELVETSVVKESSTTGDIVVAKNYLTEDEIDALNRPVVIFVETAELRAKSKQETLMGFWNENVDRIMTSNGFPVLTRAGAVSNEQMEARAGELYLQFDQDRRKQEALQADQEDEAKLRALETKLTRRSKP